jgi:hypothetical protein
MFALDEREPWTAVSAADRQGLPANIIISEPLKEIALEMLEGSRTFRHQCRRLGMVRELEVEMSLDHQTRWGGQSECYARGVIQRYQYGRIKAAVRLLTLKNAQRLIAHELEHVREYADGMNFLATSVQHPARAWLTREGHYETARAIEVGELVATEMARYSSTATLARRAP